MPNKLATWESKQTPELIEDFKRSYNDHSVRMIDLEKYFQCSTAHTVARRLKLEPRPLQKKSKKENAPSPVVSLDSLTQREEAIKKELEEIASAKRDLTVNVVRDSSSPLPLTIYGLAPQPFQTTDALALVWLQGEGARKLREKVVYKP